MERKFWLSTLATCNDAHLTSLWEKFGIEVNFTWLRKPEIGSIMCQGKIGVTGNNFNFGEVTITRCQLKTSQGKIGHGYVQGRNKHKAEIVAICDALMQTNKKAWKTNWKIGGLPPPFSPYTAGGDLFVSMKAAVLHGRKP